MASDVVVVRCSEVRLRRFLEQEIPDILSGKSPDPYGIVRGAILATVIAALEDVRRDFLSKSQGNTGEDGIQWEPLSEYTLRLRAQAKDGESGSGKRRKEVGKVDLAQIQQTRREIYKREYQRLRMGNVPAPEARRQASLTAKFLTRSSWAAQAAAIQRGLPGIRADKPGDFPILVDSERLLNSVSPGSLSGDGLDAEYRLPEGCQEGDQEVRIEGSTASVFSNVPYGDDHMTDGQGTNTGGFRPARPWKYSEVPEGWLNRWAEVFGTALAKLIPLAAAQLTE